VFFNKGYGLPWADKIKILKEVFVMAATKREAVTGEQALRFQKRLKELIRQFERRPEEILLGMQGLIEERMSVYNIFSLIGLKNRWGLFYKKYDIRDTEGRPVFIPDSFFVSSWKLERAQQDIRKHSFNSAILIPPHVSVKELLVKLIITDKLRRKAAADPIYIDSDIRKNVFLNLTTGDKPYLFLFKETSEVEKIKSEGDTADELKELFDQENLTGFGIPEYIIFFRSYFDKTGKFPETKMWTWLLKTYEKKEEKTPQSLSKRSVSSCLGAGWSPDALQLGFYEVGSDDRVGSGGGRLAGTYYIFS